METISVMNMSTKRFFGNRFYFLIKFTLVIFISLLNFATIMELADSMMMVEKHFHIHRYKFANIKVDTSALWQESPMNLECNATRHGMAPSGLELARFTYSLAPIDSAELNDNWNYIIEDELKLLIIFGYPLDEDGNHMDLELIRLDNVCSKLTRASLIIHLMNEWGPSNGNGNDNGALIAGNGQTAERDGCSSRHDGPGPATGQQGSSGQTIPMEGEPHGDEADQRVKMVKGSMVGVSYPFEQEVEFTFHGVDLTKFLINNYPCKLESLFRTTLWPGSRLMAARRDTKNNGVAIKIGGNLTVKTGDFNNGYMHRMQLEILRAFPGAENKYNLKKLCDYKHSKTISVEHFFRSMGLYPNWCTFRLYNRTGY